MDTIDKSLYLLKIKIVLSSIKEIAQLANVSSGTVDRVIHNRGGVSKKTEQRIVKLVEELNFTPNIAARNLVLKKNVTIAILIPKFNKNSPFWDEPKTGIKKALDEVSSLGLNARIYYFYQHSIESYTRVLEQVFQEKYDGLIIAPHFKKVIFNMKQRLKDLEIPYVFINVNLENMDNLSFVGQNYFESGYLAAKMFHLTLPKNTSVLTVNFLNDSETHQTLDDRNNGFKHYFETHHTEVTIEDLKIINSNKESFKKTLTKKLIESNNINGIFSPSGRIRFVAQYLEDLNINHKIVVGYDLTKENIKYLNNDIITFIIAQQPFNQGYESVKIMFDYLINDKSPKEKKYLPIELITKENLNSYLSDFN